MKHILNYFVAFFMGVASLAQAAPMDDVFSLLDNGNGTRTGNNTVDGYYIVALGTSNLSSESKGLADARMTALRQLSEVINGVTISGDSSAAMEYVSVSEEGNNQEFSSEAFHNVVSTYFNGKVSAAKLLKSGSYDGRYFSAMVITETDINNSKKLQVSQPNKANTKDTNNSLADFSNTAQQVEAKGMASMKHGEAKARKLALEDALRNAVQQAQGVMLQGKSGRFNDAIATALTTKTEGYISSYEVLEEDIARGQYSLTIDAEVNAAQLLSDISFYTNVLGEPVFYLSTDNKLKTDWLRDELESLGFSFNTNKAKSTHSFYLQQSQVAVKNHKQSTGIETKLALKLQDNRSADILFTITNNSLKTRIYVQPQSRAKQVSEHVAYKQMKKKLPIEVIQSLAAIAKRGVMHDIVIKNAKRTDVKIFKHVLNNGTSGQVESWAWDKNGKIMTLKYRFSGTLGQAFDQVLDELYSSFKTTGKGRRPRMLKVEDRQAVFKMEMR